MTAPTSFPAQPPPAPAGSARLADPSQLAQLLEAQARLENRLYNLEVLLYQLAANQTNGQHKVRINDVSMSFLSMVVFMVKWVIASIPALAILATTGFFAMLIFTFLIAAASR